MAAPLRVFIPSPKFQQATNSPGGVQRQTPRCSLWQRDHTNPTMQPPDISDDYRMIGYCGKNLRGVVLPAWSRRLRKLLRHHVLALDRERPVRFDPRDHVHGVPFDL